MTHAWNLLICPQCDDSKAWDGFLEGQRPRRKFRRWHSSTNHTCFRRRFLIL